MRRLLITLALTLAVLTAGGLAAPSAHAAYTTVHRWDGGSVFLACKRAATGPYGPVWHVQLVLAHNPNERVRHLRGWVTVNRMGADGRYQAMASTRLTTDRVGQWDVDVATVSRLGRFVDGRWHADVLTASIGDETNPGQGGDLPLGTMPSC
jgi:hypothetical protein